METNTTSKVMTRERYITTKDGIRMTYKEYREMIEAERGQSTTYLRKRWSSNKDFFFLFREKNTLYYEKGDDYYHARC